MLGTMDVRIGSSSLASVFSRSTARKLLLWQWLHQLMSCVDYLGAPPQGVWAPGRGPPALGEEGAQDGWRRVDMEVHNQALKFEPPLGSSVCGSVCRCGVAETDLMQTSVSGSGFLIPLTAPVLLL